MKKIKDFFPQQFWQANLNSVKFNDKIHNDFFFDEFWDIEVEDIAAARNIYNTNLIKYLDKQIDEKS